MALATDLKDLRRRLGRIVPAYTHDGKPVTADDIKAAGAMTVVLKDALMPNLVQTLEHTPAIMHCGPFANIAQGNNSIIADKMALKLADYVLTESGFGADMGAEKFLNIKCRKAGYAPSCILLVATIRALKLHGDAFDFPPGKTPPKELLEGENVEAVKKGCVNMRFATDTDAEVEAVKEIALESGADAAEAGDFHARGGEGAMDIGRAVIKACDQPSDFKLLYPDDMPIKQKIETIAKEIYGADGVEYSEEAEKKIAMFEELGYGNLPMCMAKTHLSLSHDPHLKAAPTGFMLPIRDIRPSIGAGFLYPLCGEMRTMPGLPSVPAAEAVDIDENGKTLGLF
jgi:formate--tetrahydrofolate ligase